MSIPFFKKIFNYTNLSERRQKQLNNEKNIDEQLWSSFKKCPTVTFEYVMKSREFNRDNFKRIYNSSMYNTPSLYSDHMNDIDSIQDFNDKEICSELRNKINIINSHKYK